jgi:hypothetical protein
MANVKITELPDIEEVSGADVLPIVDVSGSVTSKVTFTDLRTAVLDGVSGAEEWSEHAATQDVDMDGNKITGLGAPTDAADAATKQYVDTASSAVPTKIENGTSRIVITSANGDIEIYRAGTRVAFFWSGGGGQLIFGGPNGASLTLPETTGGHASIRSGGYQSAMTSTSYLQFPSGVASYMHGIHIAKAASDGLASRDPVAWTPSWSGALNVDSVTHVEASVQVINDYVDVEGSLTVTPDAAGVTVVTASIGVAFAHPAVDKDGQASAGVPGVAVQPAGCRASSAGAIQVAFEAASDEEHTVSFRVRYLKATP